MKPKAINPKETTRSEAFELWMSAPNPMVIDDDESIGNME